MQIEDVSTLTDRFQTTVPKTIRKALSLKKGDKLHYHQEANGRVYLAALPNFEADPVLEAFLKLLADDIAANPQRLASADQILLNSVAVLVADVEVDMDNVVCDDR